MTISNMAIWGTNRRITGAGNVGRLLRANTRFEANGIDQYYYQGTHAKLFYPNYDNVVCLAESIDTVVPNKSVLYFTKSKPSNRRSMKLTHILGFAVGYISPYIPSQTISYRWARRISLYHSLQTTYSSKLNRCKYPRLTPVGLQCIT